MIILVISQRNSMKCSYCPLAFREFYADSNGKYRLCCHAKPSPHSAHDMNPLDFWNSEYIENVRNRMFSNQPLEECDVCNIDQWSFRDNAIELYGIDQTNVKITLKIHMIGSYCNLSCVACHPFNSSERRKEMRFNKFREHFMYSTKGITKTRWKEISQDIIDNAGIIDTINFTGGEPLQIGRHWDLVERMPAKIAQNIVLEYDTNLTALEYNGNSIFDLKKKFRDIRLKVSCDHYGKKLELLRYPINVSQFEENLKRVKEFYPVLHLTANILNIHELREIQDYYSVPMKFPSVVSMPAFLSIRNLPDDTKREYIQKYADEKILVTEMLKTQSTNWISLAEGYFDQLFGNRDIDWREHFAL